MSLAAAGQEPSAHRQAACSLCHRGGALVNADQAARVESNCLNCHADNDLAHHSTATTEGRGCLDCHRFHGSSGATTDLARHAVGSPGLDSGHCRSCHSPEGNLQLLSEAHRTAAGLYHRAGEDLDGVSPSASCLRCHDSASTSPWQDATAGNVIAFNTHASHPYGIMVIPGSGNSFDHIRWNPDERLPLFDGKMECQSCHLLTAGTPYDLIRYENPYDLCLGCHRHETAPGGTNATTLMASLVQR